MTAIYTATQAPLNSLAFHHILSVEQFTPKLLEALFAYGQRMGNQVAAGEVDQLLRHKVVANVFYEASTRTDLSFQSATQRLGGRVITTAGGVLTGNGLSTCVRAEQLGLADFAAIAADLGGLEAVP